MKRSIFLCFLLLGIGMLSYAQPSYEVITESDGNQIIKGLLKKKDLLTNFHQNWFTANQQGYTPNASAVDALKAHGSSIHIIAFTGTWCDDSKYILPKFFMLTEAAGFPENKITLIGTDRDKKTLSYLSEALHVDKVPTFIVMKDGKEMGRVEEYGKYGMWDKELGDVIKTVATTNAGK